MIDPRLDRLAQVLVTYSVNVQPGQMVLLRGMPAAAPLLQAIYRHILRCGGHPEMNVQLPGLDEDLMRLANDEQLCWISPRLELAVEKFDAYISILSDVNTRGLTSADPQRQVLRARAQESIQRRFSERAAAGELKWVLSLFPTDAYAQDAEMSLEEYEMFVFGACLPDPADPVGYWQRLSRQQDGWVRYLAGKHQVHIIARDTDLTLNIEGRPFINCDGHLNFPDGEIFTSPQEQSAQGAIRFSFPAVEAGREVENVWLRFEEGKVVEAHADKGEDFLLKTLDTDEGSRRLGEFAIGTNAGIQKFTKNILFDEKIGGTCHLALGRSYPESLGQNESGIHWDMVCDLRQGGEIWVDDVLIHKNGAFTFDPAER